MKRLIATLFFVAGAAYGADVVLGRIDALTWTGSGTAFYSTFSGGGEAPAASGLVLDINTNGWDAYLTIPNMQTNGSYTFGFSPITNALTNAMLTLTVSSAGFDDNCTSATVSRTVYATTTIRKPVPNQLQRDEVVVDTTNTRVRLALSDYIYAGDAVSGVAVAGVYRTGTTNSPAGAITISNLSTQASPSCIANWSMPGYNLATGSTFEVRAVAFHRSAQDGRPIRAMRFKAHDSSGHTNTIYVTNATVSRLSYDTNAIVEYIGNIPTAGLVQGHTITVHFAAFPWVGGAASVLDTETTTNRLPTPLYAPQYWLCDTGGTYGVTVAVVATNGSDSTGVPVKLANFDTNSPPAAFATIGAAANKIAASNNIWYSRNDLGGSIIYLRSGGYLWTGPGSTVGNVPGSWCTVDVFPGETRYTAVITNKDSNGGYNVIKKAKVRNLKINSTSGSGTFSSPALWFDACRLEAASGVTVYPSSCAWLTGCDIGALAQGLRGFSTDNTHFSLVRSCKFDDYNTQTVKINTFLGGWRTNAATRSNFMLTDYLLGQGNSDGGILAFTSLFHTDNTGNQVVYAAEPKHIGYAIIQNIIEDSGSTGSQPLMGLFADSITNFANNVLCWHNTMVGQRVNAAYNDTSNFPVWRINWSVANNIYDDNNIKDDTFPAADGNRVGNWAEVYGVGGSGNFFGGVSNIGVAASFAHTWAGVGSIEAADGTAYGTNYVTFVSRKSYDGVASGAGNGDYHLTPNGPLENITTRKLLPFDLEGNSRAVTNRPGAYR